MTLRFYMTFRWRLSGESDRLDSVPSDGIRAKRDILESTKLTQSLSNLLFSKGGPHESNL